MTVTSIKWFSKHYSRCFNVQLISSNVISFGVHFLIYTNLNSFFCHGFEIFNNVFILHILSTYLDKAKTKSAYIYTILVILLSIFKKIRNDETQLKQNCPINSKEVSSLLTTIIWCIHALFRVDLIFGSSCSALVFFPLYGTGTFHCWFHRKVSGNFTEKKIHLNFSGTYSASKRASHL